MLSTILKFLSGGALEQVANLFKDYQDKKLTKEELKFRLETFEEQNKQDIMLAQVELNKTEAQSDHWFVAAWRPFIGWVCGLGFAMNFLVAPLGTFISAQLGSPVEFPQADLTIMLPVLLGMLGIGGLRTFEKSKGVARNKI